jgi:hypothetical protein
MKTGLVLGALLLTAVGTAASAQTAKENFSYKAPSGMFSEGTTKWQMFQFIESDAERTAQLRDGGDIATGSLSTSNSNGQSYPRPGESSQGARRPTSR